MTRITKLRRGAIDHENVFVGATLNSTGQIIVSPAGTTWELDILSSIAVPSPLPASGPYVVSLNQAVSNGHASVVKLSGTPSLDSSGDRRLFVFINGVELNSSALGTTSNTDEIEIILDYQLDETSDTIKVWYSV
jgi:hypothetical protein